MNSVQEAMAEACERVLRKPLRRILSPIALTFRNHRSRPGARVGRRVIETNSLALEGDIHMFDLRKFRHIKSNLMLNVHQSGILLTKFDAKGLES